MAFVGAEKFSEFYITLHITFSACSATLSTQVAVYMKSANRHNDTQHILGPTTKAVLFMTNTACNCLQSKMLFPNRDKRDHSMYL